MTTSFVLNFAKRHRVLLLRHEPSQIDVDISLGAMPFEEEMIARATKLKLGNLQVPVPTPFVKRIGVKIIRYRFASSQNSIAPKNRAE